jgi:hypothetical protein
MTLDTVWSGLTGWDKLSDKSKSSPSACFVCTVNCDMQAQHTIRKKRIQKNLFCNCKTEAQHTIRKNKTKQKNMLCQMKILLTEMSAHHTFTQKSKVKMSNVNCNRNRYCHYFALDIMLCLNKVTGTNDVSRAPCRSWRDVVMFPFLLILCVLWFFIYWCLDYCLPTSILLKLDVSKALITYNT